MSVSGLCKLSSEFAGAIRGFAACCAANSGNFDVYVFASGSLDAPLDFRNELDGVFGNGAGST